MGATDHKIYQERGKLNRQIGLILLAFVVLIIVGTIARRYELQHSAMEAAEAEQATESEGASE